MCTTSILVHFPSGFLCYGLLYRIGLKKSYLFSLFLYKFQNFLFLQAPPTAIAFRPPAGDLLASVKIFSEKISRSAAPCVAVAVDNAASIWRFCRIFRIIKLPECIRTVAYHSAPVIFHIFHCLVFFTTHQKCFHKMMVHIWRNHSFFRFQFHQTIQYFCSFFAADCFRQDHPYLTCS